MSESRARGRWVPGAAAVVLRWGRWVLVVLLLGAGVLVGVNGWVWGAGRGRVYAPAGGAMPEVVVGVVLGTSPRRPHGGANLHFERRMEAAAALYDAGKVGVLVVSGARTGRYYDEPRDMRAALMARGVPDASIVMDAAGVRTLDSVVRVREVFHVRRCAIISDAWHVPRALFIADRIGLEAVGVAADPIPWRQSIKARSREWMARVLVVLDLYVLGTRPQHSPTGKEPDLSAWHTGG